MIENPKMQVAEILRQGYMSGIRDFVECVTDALSDPAIAGETLTMPQVVELLNAAKDKCVAQMTPPDRN